MRALDLPIALLTLLGFVAVAPAIAHWTTGPPTTGLPVETQVLAGLVVPLAALLMLASYLDPNV